MKASQYIFAALATLSLAACNDDINFNEPMAPTGSYESYNGEDEMLRNFFILDKSGNVKQYIIGKPLNQNDSSVVSYAMSDIDAARDEFLSFLPEGAKVEYKADGSIVYTPVKIQTYYHIESNSEQQPMALSNSSTDQPTVVFTPVEKGNLMATITFNDFKSPVKRAEILYNWPLNSDSKYLEGDGIPFPTLFERDPAHYKKMVVIRESKNGRAGVLLYLSSERRKCGSWCFPRFEPNRNGMIIDGDEREMPNLNEMREYWGIINSNLKRWQKNFEDAGNRVPQYGDKCWFGKTVAWNWYTVQCKNANDKGLTTEAYSREKNWEKPFWNEKFFD